MNKYIKRIPIIIVLFLVGFIAFFLFLMPKNRIRLATTTSLDNSGLLNELLPQFEQKTGIKVDVIAVGTGKALKLAEGGDVDIIFVHAPFAEEEFMRKGFGVDRYEIMHNFFLIAGPPDDPAGIQHKDAVSAFKAIAEKKYNFISRADESGTHKKEMQLWKAANITPEGSWYLESGQGMGQTLMIADEKRAYCLTDQATFSAYKKKIALSILVRKDEDLLNPYHLIAVNPKRHHNVNYQAAIKLITWFISGETQGLIKNFAPNNEIIFYAKDS